MFVRLYLDIRYSLAVPWTVVCIVEIEMFFLFSLDVLSSWLFVGAMCCVLFEF